MKNNYNVTASGRVIGQVKAKNLNCAAKQARRKFYPNGASSFHFSVTINRNAITCPVCDGGPGNDCACSCQPSLEAMKTEGGL